MGSEQEFTLEQWVADISEAHNNHAKMIETLQLRQDNVNERLEAVEESVNSIRQSVNSILGYLDITIEGN